MGSLPGPIDSRKFAGRFAPAHRGIPERYRENSVGLFPEHGLAGSPDGRASGTGLVCPVMKTNHTQKLAFFTGSASPAIAVAVLVWGAGIAFAQEPPVPRNDPTEPAPRSDPTAPAPRGERAAPLPPSDPSDPASALDTGKKTDLSFADSHFLRTAAKDGDEVARISRVAAERASRSEVKELAQRLATEQVNANLELQTLASGKNLELPSPASDRLEKKWTSKKAAKFDADYIDKIVDDESDAVKLFTKRTESKDAAVAAFARKMLPVLQENLRNAQELKKAIETKPAA